MNDDDNVKSAGKFMKSSFCGEGEWDRRGVQIALAKILAYFVFQCRSCSIGDHDDIT